MADLRVSRSGETGHHVTRVSEDPRDGRQPPHGEDQEADRQDSGSRGSEELAVALAESGRRLVARFAQDADGRPLIRIVDTERDETVAVLTPEELRRLAEQTGLPPGLLVQAAS